MRPAWSQNEFQDSRDHREKPCFKHTKIQTFSTYQDHLCNIYQNGKKELNVNENCKMPLSCLFPVTFPVCVHTSESSKIGCSHPAPSFSLLILAYASSTLHLCLHYSIDATKHPTEHPNTREAYSCFKDAEHFGEEGRAATVAQPLPWPVCFLVEAERQPL